MEERERSRCLVAGLVIWSAELGFLSFYRRWFLGRLVWWAVFPGADFGSCCRRLLGLGILRVWIRECLAFVLAFFRRCVQVQAYAVWLGRRVEFEESVFLVLISHPDPNPSRCLFHHRGWVRYVSVERRPEVRDLVMAKTVRSASALPLVPQFS